MTTDLTTAKLCLLSRNRSILDHDYDHYPAMSIAEAARQACLLAGEPYRPSEAPNGWITKLHGSFERYGELDMPVLIQAQTVGRTPDCTHEFHIEAMQNGFSIAKSG